MLWNWSQITRLDLSGVGTMFALIDTRTVERGGGPASPSFASETTVNESSPEASPSNAAPDSRTRK